MTLKKFYEVENMKLKLITETLQPMRCEFCKSFKELFSYDTNSDVWVCSNHVCIGKQRNDLYAMSAWMGKDFNFSLYPITFAFAARRYKHFKNALLSEVIKQHPYFEQPAKNFITLKTPFLFLFSNNPGTGKTYSIIALMKYILFKYQKNIINSDIHIINELDYFDKIKEAYSEDKQEMDKIGIYNNASILIYDDLGVSIKSQDQDWHQERFYRLLNHRCDNLLPMIITSNYSVSELKDKLDFRILDRLKFFSVFEFEGCSFRKTFRNN